MTAIARVIYAGGGGVFPATTPYDRELLRDHLAYLTARRRALRVELGGQTWWLTLESAGLDCGACNRPLRIGAVMRRFATAPRCLHCALDLAQPPVAPVTPADQPARVAFADRQ